MLQISPYLNFPGNTEEAMNFYKAVFGGEFAIFQRFKDVPGTEKMSAGDREKMMHITLPIGKGNVLMATDALESMGQHLTLGNNFHLSITTESEEEADALFAKLSIGGNVEMPLEKTFWNSYFGMCSDKFGIRWMVSYQYQD